MLLCEQQQACVCVCAPSIGQQDGRVCQQGVLEQHCCSVQPPGLLCCQLRRSGTQVVHQGTLLQGPGWVGMVQAAAAAGAAPVLCAGQLRAAAQVVRAVLAVVLLCLCLCVCVAVWGWAAVLQVDFFNPWAVLVFHGQVGVGVCWCVAWM